VQYYHHTPLLSTRLLSSAIQVIMETKSNGVLYPEGNGDLTLTPQYGVTPPRPKAEQEKIA
jgi:hypothetical protein